MKRFLIAVTFTLIIIGFSLAVANGQQQNELAAESNVAAPEGGVVRQLRVQDTITSSPATVTVNILVDAVGDETEYGFTISYVPSILTNPVVSNGTAGAGIVACNTMTSPGMIFCSVGNFPLRTPPIGNPSTGEILAGINQLLIRVTFTVPAEIPPQMTAVTLTSVNALRDIAPVELTVGSQNGTVTITGPTAASVSLSGRVLTAGRRGIGNARVTLTDSSGNSRIAVTTSFGYYNFADVAAGESYVMSVAARRYVFSPPTRFISVNENISALDFTGNLDF